MRTELFHSLLPTGHKLWFTLIVAKLMWKHSIHWFIRTLCFTLGYFILQLNTHSPETTPGVESVRSDPFTPYPPPWGSMWVQYSGGVPLWLLMSPVQYETRLEGSSSFHTHTHTRARCLSLTRTSLLSWLLMWRQPSDAFSRRSCSFSLPRHSLTRCPHTSPAQH